MRTFRFGHGSWDLGQRVYLMGIVNCTPDSFSDGGHYFHWEDAVTRAETLLADGADVVDLGGESTRPGHQPVSVAEEWGRLGPVLTELRHRRPDAVISVDTHKAEVAARAIAAGADIINDIWGLMGDPGMLRVVADSQVGVVMMFNQDPAFLPGEPAIDSMVDFFARGVLQAGEAGVGPDRILVDPGLGFGYAVEDNWTVLRNLPRFRGLGAGMLVGPSRKRFLGHLTGRPPAERDVATAAVAVLAAEAGMDVVRVHEIAPTRDAMRVWGAWKQVWQP